MQAADSCRADVWLWRARFCKSRALAARMIEEGRIRMIRAGIETRLDKASRALRCGDQLVFVQGPQLMDIRVRSLGERRGPAPEARGLYEACEDH